MTPISATTSVAAAIALGCLGWVVTNFVARPFFRVYELRDHVWQELLYTVNVSMLDLEEHPASIAKLRRFSVEASALHLIWPAYIRRILALAGIDLGVAAKALLGLANTLHLAGWEKIDYRDQVEAALRLPRVPDPARR